MRLGDAFMGAGSSTTANFAEAVKIVRRELDEQGKDATQFRIAKRVYLTVDDDAARARERVLAGLHRDLRRYAGHRGGPGLRHPR